MSGVRIKVKTSLIQHKRHSISGCWGRRLGGRHRGIAAHSRPAWAAKQDPVSETKKLDALVVLVTD